MGGGIGSAGRWRGFPLLGDSADMEVLLRESDFDAKLVETMVDLRPDLAWH